MLIIKMWGGTGNVCQYCFPNCYTISAPVTKLTFPLTLPVTERVGRYKSRPGPALTVSLPRAVICGVFRAGRTGYLLPAPAPTVLHCLTMTWPVLLPSSVWVCGRGCDPSIAEVGRGRRRRGCPCPGRRGTGRRICTVIPA